MAVVVAELPVKQRRSVVFAEEPSSPPPSSILSEQARLQRMMQRHEMSVSATRQQNLETIVPFARDCQKRLDSLHGWESHGIHLKQQEATEAMKVVEQFVLATSNSQFPVTVLDGVLHEDMCRAFIDVHEKVGVHGNRGDLHMVGFPIIRIIIFLTIIINFHYNKDCNKVPPNFANLPRWALPGLPHCWSTWWKHRWKISKTGKKRIS